MKSESYPEHQGGKLVFRILKPVTLDSSGSLLGAIPDLALLLSLPENWEEECRLLFIASQLPSRNQGQRSASNCSGGNVEE